MVANERAELFSRNPDGSGGRIDVPNEVVQLAARRSRACGDRSEMLCDHFTNTSHWADRACRADFVRRNSAWHLGAVDEISVRRLYRIDSQNWFARLDAKTFRRLVATSHFHAARYLDFLVRFNREFLARGSQMARSAVALALGRWILRDLVIASPCSSCCRVAKTSRAFRVPATSD